MKCACCGTPPTHVIIYGCVNLHFYTIYACSAVMRMYFLCSADYTCTVCGKPILGYMQNVTQPWIKGYLGHENLIPGSEQAIVI
jgi:hypothetical protein